MPTDLRAREQQWVRQWTGAGAALDELRRRDLRQMSEDQALAAAENLLALAGAIKPGSPRWLSSGLVEQQALFHGRRSA